MAGDDEQAQAAAQPQQGGQGNGEREKAWRPPSVGGDSADRAWAAQTPEDAPAEAREQVGEPPTQGASAQEAARENSPDGPTALALDVPAEGGSPMADDYDAGVGTPEPPD